MTTVTLKDKILAADRQATRNGTVTGFERKLFRHGDCRYAVMGTRGLAFAIMEWAKGGREGPIPQPVGDMSASVLCVPDRGVPTLIERGYEVPVQGAPYYAFGVGADIAMGAMFMGGSAKDGVRAAIALDTSTGGRVDVLGPVK